MPTSSHVTMPTLGALLFLLVSFSTLQSIFITCTQFDVGGHRGWAIPAADDGADYYNQWASQKRFLVNDTLRFKYEEESVMVVVGDDYDKCKSSNPISYFNNVDTVLVLDRSGFFYFISGVSGHCRRGVKMVVKVLETHQNTTGQNSTSDRSSAMEKSMPTSLAGMIVAVLGFLVVER